MKILGFTGVGLANMGMMSSFFSACGYRRVGSPMIQNDKYGVTILVDGWRADLFQDMLNKGQLPNIKKHLVDRGTLVDNCAGTFPSTTGSAHLPFITGMMPGHNNCPGLRWIDRKNREARDYVQMENVLFDRDFPRSNYTLYEMLSGEYTLCIYDFASRGATKKHRPEISTLWFMVQDILPAWVQADEEAVAIFKDAYLGGGTIPRYSFVWLPSLDHLAHFLRPMSDDIYERARGVDLLVGQIMETLHKAQLYDKTIVSLVSDHGLTDTENTHDIRATLMGYGLNVMDNLSNNDGFNSLRQHNAARGLSGNGFGLLYFAETETGRAGTQSYSWDRPIEYDELRSFLVPGEGRLDLIELLRNEDAIGLLMVRERPDLYHIFSKSGEGIIEREYSRFRYSVIGTDPLGYKSLPSSANLIDGNFHDKDTWFSATTSSSYPDAPFQITQLFDSPRCGDMVISSKPGWDFLSPGTHHKASHGSLEKAEVMVPCVLAGPGIKQGNIEIARSIDLYPTYLKYLGIPNYDGEVLNVFG
jgi:predicted AlkP superfamily pyrophosphatase or phosphodiesterase